MVKKNNKCLTYTAAVIAAFAVIAMGVSFEMSNYEGSTINAGFISDGCFLCAVLFIGLGLLMWIAEAGNFYGIQFLAYCMVYTFSFRKKRLEGRKDYFTYCTEKEAEQKLKGGSTAKRALLLVGVLCLLASGALAAITYI